nr:retrovirus-related Pol polyprotein from transposon TNT 1-94 [Tanacetum cinerariifolium]
GRYSKPGGLEKQKNLSFIMSVKTRKLQRVAYSRGGMTREGYKSYTLEGSVSYEVRYSFQDTKSHQVIRSRDITFVDSIYEARFATNSSSLMKPIQKSQVVLVDIPENLAENDSIVAEHGLSLEITQSLGKSSDTSEGSKNNESFEDSEDQIKKTLKMKHSPRREASRLHRYKDPPESPWLYNESVQWKRAIIEKMVLLEKNQTCSLVRISAGKKGVDYNEIFSLVVKMTTIRLVLSIVAAEAVLCGILE